MGLGVELFFVRVNSSLSFKRLSRLEKERLFFLGFSLRVSLRLFLGETSVESGTSPTVVLGSVRETERSELVSLPLLSFRVGD